MSKRQSDYLTTLLNDQPPGLPQNQTTGLGQPRPLPTPLPTSSPQGVAKTPMTLLSRESALARVATGEVKQVTQLWLDPAKVRIWAGNPRQQAHLNESNCRDLIDAILAEGGQKVPAIVRRVSDDPNHDYEVVAGSRRHWAISWLRAHNYPDLMFLAQVHSLDDESAFRLSDIENRARKDVSDYERARTYLAALEQHYGGKQTRMAERLRLSKGWLSKMLTVGTLPDIFVRAFASPNDIQLGPCYPLAQRIQASLASDEVEYLDALAAMAELICHQQKVARKANTPLLPASEVIRRLMTLSEGDVTSKEALITLPSSLGRTALSVMSSNRNGVSIRIHAGSGAGLSELTSLFQQALSTLSQSGKGLKG
jgi:ParB family transcriptional regulator, chromosome partitioning protein